MRMTMIVAMKVDVDDIKGYMEVLMKIIIA